MVFHLQGDDAAEFFRRIVNNVREITIESYEQGFELLCRGNYVGIPGVYWQVIAQQIYCVSSISQ